MSKKEPYGEEDWKKDAPFLASLQKKGESGEVPEGYFEQFPGRLMDRIRKEAPQHPAAEGGTRRFRNWRFMSLAASIVLVAVVGIFLLRSGQSEDCLELACASTEDIREALEFENLSAEEIIDAVGDDALANFSTDQVDAAALQDLYDDTGTDSDDYLDELDSDDFDWDAFEQALDEVK